MHVFEVLTDHSAASRYTGVFGESDATPVLPRRDPRRRVTPQAPNLRQTRSLQVVAYGELPLTLVVAFGVLVAWVVEAEEGAQQLPLIAVRNWEDQDTA